MRRYRPANVKQQQTWKLSNRWRCPKDFHFRIFLHSWQGLPDTFVKKKGINFWHLFSLMNKQVILLPVVGGCVLAVEEVVVLLRRKGFNKERLWERLTPRVGPLFCYFAGLWETKRRGKYTDNFCGDRHCSSAPRWTRWHSRNRNIRKVGEKIRKY